MVEIPYLKKTPLELLNIASLFNIQFFLDFFYEASPN